MFDFRDLFQWERFITPSIIKLFYWLRSAFQCCSALRNRIRPNANGAQSAGRVILIIASLIGVVIGVIFARIIANSC
jgi:hypothetical protein